MQGAGGYRRREPIGNGPTGSLATSKQAMARRDMSLGAVLLGTVDPDTLNGIASAKGRRQMAPHSTARLSHRISRRTSTRTWRLTQ